MFVAVEKRRSDRVRAVKRLGSGRRADRSDGSEKLDGGQTAVDLRARGGRAEAEGCCKQVSKAR
jgi:hypothetical protein